MHMAYYGEGESDSSSTFETFYHHFQNISTRLRRRYSHKMECLLKVLFTSENYLSAHEIHDTLHDTHGISLSLTQLYKYVAFLEKIDFLHVVVTVPNKTKRYRLKRRFHQDHLVCEKCGHIAPFYHPSIELEQEEILSKHRFLGLHHTMILYGLCQRCQHE